MAQNGEVNFAPPVLTPAATAAAGALAAGASTSQVTALATSTQLAQVACPAFSAGAATLAMGTAKASECVVASSRTIAADSTLTLATTNAVQGFYLVTCKALALGHILTIANGGAGGGNLATFAASLTVPQSAVLYFDGTNFSYQGLVWVNP
jgi:hypothetical protein